MTARSALILIGAGVVIALMSILALRGCIKPAPPAVGPSTVSQVYAPAPVATPISPETAAIPSGHRASDYRGRLTVTVQSAAGPTPPAGSVVTPADAHPPPAAPQQVEILIPRSGPPLVRTAPGVTASVLYEPIAQPWLRAGLWPLLGASVGEGGQISPQVGTALLRASRVDLGLSGSREGIGPVAVVEFWREWAVTGQWAPVRFGGSAGSVSLGVCYRF